MILAILDPFLFHDEGPPAEWTEVIGILRALDAAILDGPYWRRAQRELVRRAMARLGARERRLVQVLLRRGEDPGVRPSGAATIAGFDELFGGVEDEALQQALRDDFDRGARLPPEVGLVVVVRTDARVAHPTPWGRERLHEFRPWQVDVQTAAGIRSVPCLRRRRNLTADPTRRFDERLPFTSDGADHPFCEPATWSDPATQPYRFTRRSQSIVDAHGRAWQRPDHGGAHHWDVQLDAATRNKLGVPYLNVTDWPGEAGRAPGSRHHRGAAGIARSKSGWTC